MTTFVLVHGAWHGSWCWKRVRRLLQAAGHEVFTPTLTGLGERSHLLSPQVDLATHIDDVVNLLVWEELNDVVLCGHSYGGCVISAVADRVPERIAALVYLDAFVLENAECLHDVLPREHKQRQLQGAAREGEEWRVPPIPAAVYNVNPADREWADRQFTAQPLACLTQPLELSGRGAAVARVTYVFASDYPASPFRRFYERAAARGWHTQTIDCGHDVMLDRPEDTARLLIETASGSTGR
jgi:pimeloyl-ACP methyl ester carboxylesterase